MNRSLHSYIKLTDPRAVFPKRQLKGDIGYDLTLISRKEVDPKVWGPNVQVYGTGIVLSPISDELYWEVYPRSSISKTPYMLANSLGIIDQGYNGELLIALRKIDAGRDDLELPARLCQLVPRIKVNVIFSLMEPEEPVSLRGAGGFGSTNQTFK